MTYCIRSPYRKDPADAEAILSAARERIMILKDELVNTEEPDNGERDDDSGLDMAEDPDADDIGTETNNKDASDFVESSLNTSVKNREGKGENLQTPDVGNGQMDVDLASIVAEDYNQEIAGRSNVNKPDMEDAIIDESNPGEPWVEGLTEGDYSNLSVEDRLNALVALIGVAIEGNSIRFVLEVLFIIILSKKCVFVIFKTFLTLVSNVLGTSRSSKCIKEADVGRVAA